MADLAKLKQKLERLAEVERKAMTRLRRAVTLHDKAFDRRFNVQRLVIEMERQVQRVAERLK